MTGFVITVMEEWGCIRDNSAMLNDTSYGDRCWSGIVTRGDRFPGEITPPRTESGFRK